MSVEGGGGWRNEGRRLTARPFYHAPDAEAVIKHAVPAFHLVVTGLQVVPGFEEHLVAPLMRSNEGDEGVQHLDDVGDADDAVRVRSTRARVDAPRAREAACTVADARHAPPPFFLDGAARSRSFFWGGAARRYFSRVLFFRRRTPGALPKRVAGVHPLARPKKKMCAPNKQKKKPHQPWQSD